eukprot:CAMPEP_0117443470 /NCGR_PEP_ID=MMETSP0759-20121206/4710_1 /TAXON_ID=63605 /ORGANISM="Percolomonas cosmopolitus, Strain WS" /LENGTH=351 /DNA_ID=CAMNT_0005235443 /DNA_START=30 /DNA_END=1083 /DNA_ORIENTATION=+
MSTSTHSPAPPPPPSSSSSPSHSQSPTNTPPPTFLDAWLANLKIAPAHEYKQTLVSEAFDDFDSLIELEEADLQEFGFKRGHQKKILRWTHEMSDEAKRRHFLTRIGFGSLEHEDLEHEQGHHRMNASGASLGNGVSQVVDEPFSNVYTLLGERLKTIASHHEPHMEKAFIEFVHNATFFLSTHQSRQFIEICFHPVDIASLRYLEISLHDLASKLENGETNYLLHDFHHLFKSIIDDEDKHVKRIESISNTEQSRDRYGGEFAYKSEKGDFLWRYVRLDQEQQADGTCVTFHHKFETNYLLHDFHHLFKSIIDDEDKHVKRIESISNTEQSRDRYGGEFAYKSEKGDFLW